LRREASAGSPSAYIGHIIAISDHFRGRDPRLSTDLILRCPEHRPVPESREVTIPGYKALAAGLDVPANVREDYGF
jgi:hypothetical protein